MALGNANTSAQARGKNKATKIKKRKEIAAAASLTAFACSDVAGSAAAGCALATQNNTYYHNGSIDVPAVNDIVYKERRLRDASLADAGYYQFTNRGRKGTLNINSSGVVTESTACP